jgi:acetyl-CoA carboxylase biotin carboxyl carrier protein
MADPSPSGDVFHLPKLRELIALMKEHDLSEVDLKQDEQQIRLVRGGAGPVAYSPAPSFSPPPAAAAPSAPAASAGPAADGPNIKIVKSPMVGTFYSKPSPDAKNFVAVGDHVGPESVVCIIEAMKVFNEIQAEVSGQIVAVLVANEEPVEFGKPLFKVDTSK